MTEAKPKRLNMNTSIFKYRLLQILTLCAAAGISVLGFCSSDVIAESASKLEKKIMEKGNKPNPSIDQLASSVTEEITTRILAEIKGKFDSYYGSYVVTGATAQGKHFTYYLKREDQVAAGICSFNSELLIGKVGKNFAAISKAEVRWDNAHGVVIDYMNSKSVILASECYLDIRPLLKFQYFGKAEL